MLFDLAARVKVLGALTFIKHSFYITDEEWTDMQKNVTFLSRLAKKKNFFSHNGKIVKIEKHWLIWCSISLNPMPSSNSYGDGMYLHRSGFTGFQP